LGWKKEHWVKCCLREVSTAEQVAAMRLCNMLSDDVPEGGTRKKVGNWVLSLRLSAVALCEICERGG